MSYTPSPSRIPPQPNFNRGGTSGIMAIVDPMVGLLAVDEYGEPIFDEHGTRLDWEEAMELGNGNGSST
jgi:hypothetical protein